MEEEDYIIATWVQEDVETFYNLLNKYTLLWVLNREYCSM
jgi:hypothetical protein